MTKNEYISALGRELKRLGVADAGDVVEEYEQHFAFKSADGCSEEETAARLGDTAVLAAQFAGAGGKESSGALTRLGLGVLWVFAALFFVLLAAWAVVMAAFTLACAACAVCLLTGIGVGGLIPDMPYLCAAVFAVALAALAVLSAVGTVYYLAFVRAVVRSWTRFACAARRAAPGRRCRPEGPAPGAGIPGRVRGLLCTRRGDKHGLGGLYRVLARLGLVRIRGGLMEREFIRRFAGVAIPLLALALSRARAWGYFCCCARVRR